MNKRLNLLLVPLFLLLCTGIQSATAEEPIRQTVNLKVGGTRFINSPEAVKRVSIVNPDIADIVIISPKQLYAYGKQPGYTTVLLWQDSSSKILLDLVVSLDLTALKEKLYELYPNEPIRVHGSETGVVLSGTVSGPEVVEEVLRLTRTFLPRQAKAKNSDGGTGTSGDGITNLLRVGGIQQVLLEVRFAEVTRNSDKDWQAGLGLDNLGNDFRGAFGVNNIFAPAGNASFDALLHNPSSLLFNFADNAPNVFVQIDNFKAALHMLEVEKLARVLAEPRLITQSGKEASFLAGGEFPIPVPRDDGEISIEFKEFGVALRFTPIILSDGKISLRVAPSVSQISSTSSIPAGIVGADFIAPSFATRKLDTTVELYDGQTIALAGLLQDELREQVNKIPGLGDLPILGQLFRSTSYQQQKTDLLIAVTPHLVKPVKEGELLFPGENMNPPNAYEFYLEGRFEGRRQQDQSSEKNQHSLFRPSLSRGEGGLEGTFGHEPVQNPQKEEEP